MEIEIQDIIDRYATELARQTQRAILAEAQVAALQAKLDNASESEGDA